MTLLGSSADAIDIASDRGRFDDFLNGLGIPQPPGGGVTSVDEALNIAKLIGYPVLVRPSYVLGGRAMEIVHDASELVRYMSLAMELDTRHPVLIDKYLAGKEVEVDAIGDGERVFIPGVMPGSAGLSSDFFFGLHAATHTTTDTSTAISMGTRVFMDTSGRHNRRQCVGAIL